MKVNEKSMRILFSEVLRRIEELIKKEQSISGKLTDSKIAEELKLSKGALSTYRKEEKLPVNYLVEFATRKGVSLDYIFYGIDVDEAKGDRLSKIGRIAAGRISQMPEDMQAYYLLSLTSIGSYMPETFSRKITEIAEGYKGGIEEATINIVEILEELEECWGGGLDFNAFIELVNTLKVPEEIYKFLKWKERKDDIDPYYDAIFQSIIESGGADEFIKAHNKIMQTTLQEDGTEDSLDGYTLKVINDYRKTIEIVKELKRKNKGGEKEEK